MSIFIVDYKEQVKKLIADQYQPSDALNKEFEYTTEQITENLEKIFPHKAIDEHMVYEAMLELGFTPKEDPKKPLAFSWYFERKH